MAEVPTGILELLTLRDDLQAEVFALQEAMDLAEEAGESTDFLVQRLDTALQRLDQVVVAIAAWPDVEPPVEIDPRDLVPDHVAGDFSDRSVWALATGEHAVTMTILAEVLETAPLADRPRIRSQIAGQELHLQNHGDVWPDVPPTAEVEEEAGFLAPLFDYLDDLWSGLTTHVGETVDDARRLLRDQISPLTGFAAATWDVLNPGLDPAGNPLGALYHRLDLALDDRLPDDLGDVGAGILGVSGQLVDLVTSGIPDAIAGAQEGVASAIGQGFEIFFRGAGELIGTTLGSAATAFLEELETHYPIFGFGLFQRILDNPFLPDEVRPLFQEAAEPTAQVGALFAQQATQSAMGATVGGFMDTLLAPLTRDLRRAFLPGRLDLDTLVAASFRNLDPPEGAALALSELGLGNDYLRILRELGRPRPGLGELQTLVNRADLDEADAAQELVLRGYLPTDATNLIALRYVLPGPSDLVRFSVREVFDEGIVSLFGLDEGSEGLPFALAAQVGFQEETLRLNWRAHWELPSITQAFEMLHRDVIDADTLQLLLRTQDVMPFWREKITAIAFATFTRVDIRRFFRQGVFDVSDVVRRYQDIGYTLPDAQLQADFVLAEDDDRNLDRALPEIRQQVRLGVLSLPLAEDRLRTITQDATSIAEALDLLSLDASGQRLAEILSAHRQALRQRRTTPELFRGALQEIGVVDDVIDHLVDVEEVRRGEESAPDEEVQLRASGRGTAVRRFREGLTQESGFRAEMAVLGYGDLETDRYLDIAVLERDTNYRLDLVRATLTAFRKGRITRDQLEAQLEGLVDAPELVESLVQGEIARIRVEDPDADEVELRATGRGVVLRRFREGWIDAAGFSDEMGALGYTDAEISQYQLVAQLEADFDWKQDVLNAARAGFRKEVITPTRFIEVLTGLGMDLERAQTHLSREQLAKGLDPVVPPPAEAPPPA